MILVSSYADNALYALINVRANTVMTINGIANFSFSIFFMILNILFILHIICVNKVAFEL